MTEAHYRAEDFGRVAVLMGGDSPEREISLRGGTAVLEALRASGVDAMPMDAAGRDLLRALEREAPDRVFIMLHGGAGEDGRVQAVLELMELPYTGSGVMASALAMDKIQCKKVWMADGLPTPPFEVLGEGSDWDAVIARLGTVFVKPVREGSSIGISRADSPASLRQAWAEARRFDSLVIGERLISGPEFTITILGERALPVIELKAQGVFYDFHAKYESEATRYLCPTSLGPQGEAELQGLASRAYRAAGCRGWGRVDVMQDAEGAFSLLEVNTVPGMTDHSLVPMAARAAGMSFEALVLEILASSLEGGHE